jgi:hypothetical protein
MTLEGSPLNAHPQTEAPALPRLFLHEPGWRVGMKVGSEREFCYATAPGQDYYHRLMDGELFLYRPDEKLCMPCASRRGLLTYGPRPLREPIAADALDVPEDPSDYEVKTPPS